MRLYARFYLSGTPLFAYGNSQCVYRVHVIDSIKRPFRASQFD